MKILFRSLVPPPLTASQIHRLANRSNLSTAEIQESYERFVHCYVDGYLSLDEFLFYLKRLHRHAGHPSFSLDRFLVKRLFQRFDRDHDRQLNFEEFFFGNLAMHQQPDKEKLTFILKLCDRNQTKYYTQQQTVTMLNDLCDLFDLPCAREVRWKRIRSIVEQLYPGHRNNKISWTNLCTSIRKRSSLFNSLLSDSVEDEDVLIDSSF